MNAAVRQEHCKLIGEMALLVGVNRNCHSPPMRRSFRVWMRGLVDRWSSTKPPSRYLYICVAVVVVVAAAVVVVVVVVAVSAAVFVFVVVSAVVVVVAAVAVVVVVGLDSLPFDIRSEAFLDLFSTETNKMEIENRTNSKIEKRPNFESISKSLSQSSARLRQTKFLCSFANIDENRFFRWFRSPTRRQHRMMSWTLSWNEPGLRVGGPDQTFGTQ